MNKIHLIALILLGLLISNNGLSSTRQTELSNGKQYVFFYLMKKDPKIQRTVQKHIEYWKTNMHRTYTGGPFNDRSGGMILFQADNLSEATRLIINDPFNTENLIKTKWVKEWIQK